MSTRTDDERARRWRQRDFDVPTLRAYAERIGAVQKNFTRYVVEVEGKTVAAISIKDGKVNCDVERYAPTDEEKQAIENEIITVEFPKSIEARKGSLPDELAGVDPQHYSVHHDKTGEHITFIQWRRDGEKPDLPLSFWSDGEWRMMEPDVLPAGANGATRTSPQYTLDYAPSCLEAALDLATRRNWWIFPADSSGEKKSHKAAKFSNGQTWGMTKDPEEIKRDFARWPDANLGIPTGQINGIFVVEADTLEGHSVDGIAALMALEAKNGVLPLTLTAMSPTGSIHRYFKHPGPGIKIVSRSIVYGVDVKGDGGMVIAPPSVRPNVGSYRWVNRLDPADAPQWLIDLITADNHDQRSPAEPGPKPGNLSADAEEIHAALAVISSDAERTWFEVGAAIGQALGDADGFPLFDWWSRKSTKYDEDECAAKWKHLLTITGYSAGTIFHYASESDPTWRIRYIAEQDRIANAAVAEMRKSACLPFWGATND